MSAQGSSVWTPAWDGERASEARVSCPSPRCGGWVMALGRVLVCTELACDWTRDRFGSVEPTAAVAKAVADARPSTPRPATPRPAGASSRTRSRSAAVLELVKARPWITATELAAELGCTQETCHIHLGREHAASVDRRRLEKGGPWRYAVIGTPPPVKAGGSSIDLTARTLEVLAAIAAADGEITRAELGERVGLSLTRVTHHLAPLLQAALVVETMGRRRTLAATEAGRARVQVEPEVELELLAGDEPEAEGLVEVDLVEGDEPEPGVEVEVVVGDDEPQHLEQLVEVELLDAPPQSSGDGWKTSKRRAKAGRPRPHLAVVPPQPRREDDGWKTTKKASRRRPHIVGARRAGGAR